MYPHCLLVYGSCLFLHSSYFSFLLGIWFVEEQREYLIYKGELLIKGILRNHF